MGERERGGRYRGRGGGEEGRTDKQINGQTERQTNRQRDRQTNRQKQTPPHHTNILTTHLCGQSQVPQLSAAATPSVQQNSQSVPMYQVSSGGERLSQCIAYVLGCSVCLLCSSLCTLSPESRMMDPSSQSAMVQHVQCSTSPTFLRVPCSTFCTLSEGPTERDTDRGADHLASTADITSGLDRAEVLRGLRNFLNMDRPEHHGINCLKERGVEKGSGRHSTLRGRERSTPLLFRMRV